MIFHWVNDDQHISKVGWDDAGSVVPGVLRPNYVHFIVSQVTQLQHTNKANQMLGGRAKGTRYEAQKFRNNAVAFASPGLENLI